MESTSLVAWIGLALGIGTTVFWCGVYFGSVKHKLARLARALHRIRDLERAYEKISKRKFVARFPENDDDLKGVE